MPLSSRRSECQRQPLTAADSPTKLDVVVLFTTDFLTESALFAARRLADELDALIRLVRIEDGRIMRLGVRSESKWLLVRAAQKQGEKKSSSKEPQMAKNGKSAR